MSSARPCWSGFLVVFAVLLSVSPASAADWPAISPEEIKMTDIDQQKGAPAVILERKPRHFPFQFEGTSRETDMYEIDLPKEYVVDDVPDPVKVDMGFAMYQSKVEVVGSKLRYSREFVQRNVLIPPDRTEDLRKLEGIIGADEVAAVVLKRAQ